MTDFIAVLSTGKGTWSEVSKLIKAEEWENIYLITNLFGAQNFSSEKKLNFIVIDQNSDITKIKKAIYDELKGNVKIEAALNIHSGTGKEHMALIAAALQLGIGIRLVTMQDDRMIEI